MAFQATNLPRNLVLHKTQEPHPQLAPVSCPPRKSPGSKLPEWWWSWQKRLRPVASMGCMSSIPWTADDVSSHSRRALRNSLDTALRVAPVSNNVSTLALPTQTYPLQWYPWGKVNFANLFRWLMCWIWTVASALSARVETHRDSKTGEKNTCRKKKEKTQKSTLVIQGVPDLPNMPPRHDAQPGNMRHFTIPKFQRAVWCD